MFWGKTVRKTPKIPKKNTSPPKKVENYSKKFLIDCIQIEISQDLRLNNILDFTSNAISSGICNFYKKNYL